MLNVKVGIGWIVSVQRGVVMHVGLVSRIDWTGAWVISQSGREGRVVEERLEDFAAGGDVGVEGYPGEFSPHQVIERARAMIGQPYDLLRFNCEHFVRWCHGLEPISPQLQKAVKFGAIVAVVGIAVIASHAKVIQAA